MPIDQHLILISPPADFSRAAAFSLPVAHMAYRIGESGSLYRTEIPASLTDGLMVLSADGFEGQADPSLLCRDVVRECSARKFDGILCDFGTAPTPFQTQTISQLGAIAEQRGWHLYVTEPYAALNKNSLILIPTAITSGSLETRLKTAVDQYGPNRLALAVQASAREFLLPATGEPARIIERPELAELMRRFSPAVFFDNNLCAHYFTYMDRNSARFVLFDDSGSILRKLALARQLGISRAVLVFPEVENILTRLLAE